MEKCIFDFAFMFIKNIFLKLFYTYMNCKIHEYLINFFQFQFSKLNHYFLTR